MKRKFKATAMACALVMALGLTGCSSSAQKYTFEAEKAIIKDGNGAWPAVNQVGINAASDKYTQVDGISNFSDGTSMTWKITAEKAGTATITLKVGSHLREWGADDGIVNGIDDISKALSLTVNGTNVAISGSVSEGPQQLPESVTKNAPEGALAYFIAEITAEINLVAGENDITFTSLGEGGDYNLYMESLDVESPTKLTFTETDNSSRVWSM